MLLKIFYFIFLFSFISLNNKTNWTINSLTKHLKNKFNLTDLYYIEDDNNYLTKFEKIILFDGLKKVYEYYHYRTFVILINKVNEKYKNFSNFTLEVEKFLKNKTKKQKDEDRYLIFFYSVEDVKFSYIRGKGTIDIITDREVNETIIGMDNILRKKEIFFAVNNLINTEDKMVKNLLVEVITTAFENIKSAPEISIQDAIDDSLREWDLLL